MNGPFNDYWNKADRSGFLDKALSSLDPPVQDALKELVKINCQCAFNAGVRYGTGEMVTRLMERSPVGKEGE